MSTCAACGGFEPICHLPGCRIVELEAMLSEAKSDAQQAWTEHLSECEEQTGYMRGQADERRRIVAWLRSYDDVHRRSAMADRIEKGEHAGVPVVAKTAKPLRPLAEDKE